MLALLTRAPAHGAGYPRRARSSSHDFDQGRPDVVRGVPQRRGRRLRRGRELPSCPCVWRQVGRACRPARCRAVGIRRSRRMEVNAEAMACGITLAQHYAAEMLRLQGGAICLPDLRLASRLLAWWQARPDPRCHLAALYQRGLNAISDAATARRIVGILEEHGWVASTSAGNHARRGGPQGHLGTGAVSALNFDPWAALNRSMEDGTPPKAPNPPNQPAGVWHQIR